MSSTFMHFTSMLLYLDMKPFGLLAVTMLHGCKSSSSFSALRFVAVIWKFAITLVYITPSLSQTTHIYAAPTLLLPVTTSLASTAKAIPPPREKWCPLKCVNVYICGLLFRQAGCPCGLIEILISSSDRDVRCYLYNLEWKILWCGPGVKPYALSSVL